MTPHSPSVPRVLLLMPPATYRAGAFLGAAESAGVEIVHGVDLPRELADYWHVPLGLDFSDPEAAAQQIVNFAHDTPLAAVLAVDDSGSLIAALASARLGLPHNDPHAALAARDKSVMRDTLSQGGVRCPGYRRVALDADPCMVGQTVSYPCVVKPLRLNGSRGVIRADTPEQFAVAFARVKRMLEREGPVPAYDHILVEDFIPGFEVALEGLLTNNLLHVLALFDKPDPLDGPYFEETLYVTPSRLPPATQAAIVDEVRRAVAALKLREGPVHAELRVNESGPWMLEVAGRSIGGLCSSVLRFGTDVCLEELILRHAAGQPLPTLEREQRAAGVMMLPIEHAGILRGYTGVEQACSVPGVDGVEITAKRHYRVVPLPEGESYLGFIFAHGESPADVESALRAAHACLSFDIRPELPVLQAG